MSAKLTFLFLLIGLNIFGQADHTRYTIEYSLHYSGALELKTIESSLAHSVFAKVELASKRTWRISFGIAFIQPRIILRDHSGQQPYRDHEFHYQYNYLVIPAGIKFNLGSFYLHPEIGNIFYQTLLIKTYVVDEEMNKINGPSKDHYSTGQFEFKLATLMTIGYEVKVGSVNLLTGIKGYFAFPGSINTYGIGLVLGVKI